MNASHIKIFAMDADGTLTDGKIYMGSEGEVMKAFDVKDGYAIAHMLPEMKIIPAIITGRRSEIVSLRCRELGIRWLYQGIDDKTAAIHRLASETDTPLSQMAYMGDDLNDLKGMRAIKDAGGLVCCPSDATQDIRSVCHFATNNPGGKGAVREAIERIGRARKTGAAPWL